MCPERRSRSGTLGSGLLPKWLAILGESCVDGEEGRADLGRGSGRSESYGTKIVTLRQEDPGVILTILRYRGISEPV